jgi:tryptophan-rich sensory protein
LWSVLVALFWVSVAFAAWTADVNTIIPPRMTFVLFVFTLRFVPFFVAIGALFKKSWIGAAVGLLAWVAILALAIAFPEPRS